MEKIKDMVIYFTRYVNCKSIEMLSLYFYKVMERIEEHEGKKYLMVDEYILNKVFDKITEIISIEKCDDTKILINGDDKLPGDVTLNKLFN